MDVWFDSGSSHTGAMMDRGLGYPADLYFEGSDQYRGWFNSSLIVVLPFMVKLHTNKFYHMVSLWMKRALRCLNRNGMP